MTDDQIMKVVDRAVDCFQGDLNDIESAIGMLLIGRHYGWRVVFLIRSNAWRPLDDGKNFWKVVRGQIAAIRSSKAEPPR